MGVTRDTEVSPQLHIELNSPPRGTRCRAMGGGTMRVPLALLFKRKLNNTAGFLMSSPPFESLTEVNYSENSPFLRWAVVSNGAL